MSRINPKDAFDPRNATDEEWLTFEKSVGHFAQDPELDVAKLFPPTPLGLHDSMNAVSDAISELLEQRAEEIREWMKNNISLQKIGEIFIEGIESLPDVNILQVFDWNSFGKMKSSSGSSKLHDDQSLHD